MDPGAYRTMTIFNIRPFVKNTFFLVTIQVFEGRSVFSIRPLNLKVVQAAYMVQVVAAVALALTPKERCDLRRAYGFYGWCETRSTTAFAPFLEPQTSSHALILTGYGNCMPRRWHLWLAVLTFGVFRVTRVFQGLFAVRLLASACGCFASSCR